MPETEPGRLTHEQARGIALKLNAHQAATLRAIDARDLDHGWDDMSTNRALKLRGLISYFLAKDIDGPRGVREPRTVVTDVKVTRAGQDVMEWLNILAMPGAYTGRSLGKNQRMTLQSLEQRNSGVWWPGCGWLLDSVSSTVRVLDSLVALGLASRSATEAGSPKFTITDTGRMEAQPFWRRCIDARNAYDARTQENAT